MSVSLAKRLSFLPILLPFLLSFTFGYAANYQICDNCLFSHPASASPGMGYLHGAGGSHGKFQAGQYAWPFHYTAYGSGPSNFYAYSLNPFDGTNFGLTYSPILTGSSLAEVALKGSHYYVATGFTSHFRNVCPLAYGYPGNGIFLVL